jgi:hypothetical protein
MLVGRGLLGIWLLVTVIKPKQIDTSLNKRNQNMHFLWRKTQDPTIYSLPVASLSADFIKDMNSQYFSQSCKCGDNAKIWW